MNHRIIHAQRGFNLLEVVVAIAVFFIGMLALASLQGALTRSMADAKVRTEAANLAERAIEQFRGFTSLTATAGFDYADIVDATGTYPASGTVNGVVYTIDVDVTDYYYAPDTGLGGFSQTPTAGAATSDYKDVEVIVSWDANPNLRAVDEDGGDLAAITLYPAASDVRLAGVTGVKVSATIPALVTSASAKVTEEAESTNPTPDITYQPGQRPDVIALSLGNNRFKESLTPIPDVIRTDELVETSFDVITYSSDGTDAFFLRREEFTAVSCECTMKAADASNPGRRPVVWAGDEYAGGHLVTKPYGVSANNQQSTLCDTCCRDHHDGGSSADDYADTASNQYGPFKGASEYYTTFPFSGDHKHYTAAGALATVNSTYLEACRMVRVNGFNRVMQDFRREDEFIFPPDYLDGSEEIDVYSAYVTSAATAFEGATSGNYESSPPCIGDVACSTATPPMQGAWPAVLTVDGSGNPTELPSWTGVNHVANETKQLRSRGIYIDYMSDDLRSMINCLQGGSSVETCNGNGYGDVELDRTGSGNVLEIMPFFDVQLTWLDRWNETPANTPIDVTNEELLDNNAHSRGVASTADYGGSTVEAESHRGNLGFTDTQAIDPEYATYKRSVTFTVQGVDGLGNGGTTPPGSGNFPILSGTISHTVNGNPSFTITAGGDALCGRTAFGWECEVPSTSTTATVTISGYGQAQKVRFACATDLDKIDSDPNGTAAYATFSLVGEAPGTTYDIVVSSPGSDPCP